MARRHLAYALAMTGIRTVFAVSAALLLLQGCSGDPGGGPAEASATATVTETVTATPTPEEEATEPPEPEEIPAMGESQATEWGTVAVKQFNPSVTTDPNSMRAEGATRWSGALVRTCVDRNWQGEAIKLSWDPWALTDKAGGNFLTSQMSGGVFFPSPTYPQFGDRTTRPGTCAEGWIVFNTSGAGRFAEAVYEGQNLPTPLVWRLS